MIEIVPVGHFGQVGDRSAILAEAITKALALYRLQTFPTNPQNPWKISAASFSKLVSKTQEYAANGYSDQQIAAAIVARGYSTSDLSPYERPAPAIRPAAPIIYLPAPPEPPEATATIRTEVVRREPIPYQPQITVPEPPPPIRPPTPISLPQQPIQLPPPQPVMTVPVVREPEQEPASKTGWLLAAGLFAVMLSRGAA